MKSTTNTKRKSAVRKEKFSTFNFQLSILFLFSLLMSGCTKEDGMGAPTADPFDGTVTAMVENGASYNAEIGAVYALYNATVNSVTGQLTGQTLGNGDYAGGGFTLNLAAIPVANLMNIQTFFTTVLEISKACDFSDPDTRLLNADFYAITKAGNYADYFIYARTGSKRTTCLFVYADREATVAGGRDVSVAFRPGWNRIYYTPADKKVVSSAPGGMKWYLQNDTK